MKRVLFIDWRNSVRGPMAQAWFNHLSAGGSSASSCGTGPARGFDGNVVTVMREVGVEMPPWTPRAVNQTILLEADLVVIMGPDITPDAFAPTFVWTFRDPDDQQLNSYRRLRDAIRSSVEILSLSFMTDTGAGVSLRPRSSSAIARRAEGEEARFVAALPGRHGQIMSFPRQTLAALQALRPVKNKRADIGRCDHEILRRYPLRGLDTDARLRVYDHLERCEACFEHVYRICKERDARFSRQDKGRRPGKRSRPQGSGS
jgi:protein-tyrosine-phosphatase